MSSNKKKILAISGSLRAGSSNHHILRFLGSLSPVGVAFTLYNGVAQLPHFDTDLDTDPPPAPVAELRKLIADADGIVICTPEYAYGVPGSLKNALDWTVSSGSLVDKPLMLVSASTGGENAHAALLLILHALSANVLKNSALLISFIRSKIDKDGNITDTGAAEDLRKGFEELLLVV
jgi:chromate reductase, NAD(P)H dehydrogenase (quinone)